MNCNAYNIAEEMTKKNLESKFDLVTIGEALHWFDIDELMGYITNSLLTQQGKFCVLSYNSPIVEYNVQQDEEFQKKA